MKRGCFFSEIITDICDESLTKEGCRVIFEKKLLGPRYLVRLSNSMIC